MLPSFGLDALPVLEERMSKAWQLKNLFAETKIEFSLLKPWQKTNRVPLGARKMSEDKDVIKLGECCVHGSLKRQCLICDLDSTIAELRAQLASSVQSVKDHMKNAARNNTLRIEAVRKCEAKDRELNSLRNALSKSIDETDVANTQLAEAKKERDEWSEYFEIASKSFHESEEQCVSYKNLIRNLDNDLIAAKRHFELCAEYTTMNHGSLYPMTKEQLMSEIIAADEKEKHGNA